MTVDVGISGGLSVDHLVTSPVAARFDCLGGPGLYAALGAGLVAGTRVRLYSALPQSTSKFAETLSAAGVDLGFCTLTPDVPRVWILNSPDGRRIVPTTPRPGSELDEGDETADARPLLAPGPGFFDGLAGMLYCAPQAIGTPPPGLTVGVDPDQREVLSRGANYWRAISVPGGVLLPSRVQLTIVDSDPRQAVRKLARTMGVSVSARLDADGAFAVDAAGGQWAVHDANAAVVDTTGAGDTSAGALVAALAAGADLATATAFGVSAARVVLSDWGHTALSRYRPLAEPLPGVHITQHRGAS
ncbi:MAG: PfkB family carbohydrate kinase [Frankia sp.]